MSIVDRLKALFGNGASNGSASGKGTAPDGTGDGGEMISCEDALRLVHEFLDGELDSVPESQVKQHFDVCQKCYPHLHLENAFREAVRRAASGESAPEELKMRVAALIADAKAND